MTKVIILGQKTTCLVSGWLRKAFQRVRFQKSPRSGCPTTPLPSPRSSRLGRSLHAPWRKNPHPLYFRIDPIFSHSAENPRLFELYSYQSFRFYFRPRHSRLFFVIFFLVSPFVYCVLYTVVIKLTLYWQTSGSCNGCGGGSGSEQRDFFFSYLQSINKNKNSN